MPQRRRPDRVGPGLFGARKVQMPESTSFPSGHAASAFAFAYAVGRHLPGLAVPIRLLAGGVAYSRVHTGVYYPGDADLLERLVTAREALLELSSEQLKDVPRPTARRRSKQTREAPNRIRIHATTSAALRHDPAEGDRLNGGDHAALRQGGCDHATMTAVVRHPSDHAALRHCGGDHAT